VFAVSVADMYVPCLNINALLFTVGLLFLGAWACRFLQALLHHDHVGAARTRSGQHGKIGASLGRLFEFAGSTP
jgi:hypothetical protein